MKIDLNNFFGVLKIPLTLRSLDYLMSYIALSRGMGFEGNPLMAYLISIHPATISVGFLFMVANIFILVKMYSRYTKTVLFCYYFIIVAEVFLLIRNIIYMTLYRRFYDDIGKVK